MQNLSNTPFIAAQPSSPPSAQSFKAIFDQLNHALSENSDPQLKKRQLHQFILACVHLKSGFEKRLSERKVCQAKDTEPLPFQTLIHGEKEKLDIKLLFGAKTLFVDVRHGKEEVNLVLKDAVLTIMFSSLSIDAELLAQILKRLPAASLAPIAQIDNKTPFPLTAKAVRCLAQFCPQSLSHLLRQSWQNPDLLDLELISGNQKTHISQDMAAIIWPELTHFLSKFPCQKIAEFPGKKRLDCSLAKLIVSHVKMALEFIVEAPSIEKIAMGPRLLLLHNFHLVGDLKRAALFLAAIEPIVQAVPASYQHFRPLVVAIQFLKQSPYPLPPEMMALVDKYLKVLNRHCDQYIYRQLLQLMEDANSSRVAAFQKELAEMSFAVKSLGHTWYNGPAEESINIYVDPVYSLILTDALIQLLSPLKHVETLEFNGVNFIATTKAKTPSIQIFKLLQKCFPQVTSLSLTACKFNRSSVADLVKWEHLQTLIFRRCLTLGSKGAKKSYLQSLQASPSLKKLCMLDCPNVDIGNGDLSWVANSQLSFLALGVNNYANYSYSPSPTLPGLGKIEHFYLDLLQKPELSWHQSLFKAINAADQLKKVTLRLNQDFPFSLPIVNPSVSQLVIRFKALAAKTISDIQRIISWFPNLETLEVKNDLRANEAQTFNLLRFLNNLPHFKQLIVSHDLKALLDAAPLTSPLKFTIEKGD